MSKVNARILIIDDDPDVMNAARVVLRQRFENVETESNPQRIISLLKANSYDVILLDMNFSPGRTGGHEGLFWLRSIREVNPSQHVILITAYGEINLAVEAMKSGAADFIVKPWDNEKLESTVLNAVNNARAIRKTIVKQEALSPLNIIGESELMNDVLTIAKKVAATDANVLILGENGTGKDILAQYIHEHSSRRTRPFVKVDTGSLSPTLFESELFGHRKGAFTDAKEERQGKFQIANAGTLFLDEIGNIQTELQSKLLSALQDRQVTPLGSNGPVAIDIRLIAATNINLKEAVAAGSFREDLYYRINTVEITLPALRNRTEDIPLLANYFKDLYTRKYQKDPKTVSAGALKLLESYEWPGNVRELQHAMERAVILSDASLLTETDFAFSSTTAIHGTSAKLEDVEKEAILKAIRQYDGNMSKVAKALGVGRTTLYRKLAKFGLDKNDQ